MRYIAHSKRTSSQSKSLEKDSRATFCMTLIFSSMTNILQGMTLSKLYLKCSVYQVNTALQFSISKQHPRVWKMGWALFFFTILNNFSIETLMQARHRYIPVDRPDIGMSQLTAPVECYAQLFYVKGTTSILSFVGGQLGSIMGRFFLCAYTAFCVKPEQ